jgi:formamidopyrimidine-DNA glycosylase
MPELPDVTIYVEHLRMRLLGRTLLGVQQRSPFVVRTFEPDIHSTVGMPITEVDRLGKRIYWQFDAGTVMIFHLMIAGRFHLRKVDAKARAKSDLMSFRFDEFTVMLTEASSKKRASVHVHRCRDELAQHTRSGLDVLNCSLVEFSHQIRSESRTLKRILTNPNKFDGIGNAYSDEILHAAGLSPVQRTNNLDEAEIRRLYEATQRTMLEWIARLRADHIDKFPEKVTAFRPEMAVHGKYNQPCPVCQSPVQRITYADNETNYCATCQTGGKLLADRSLSRLLKDDWPKTLEEWEEGQGGGP